MVHYIWKGGPEIFIFEQKNGFRGLFIKFLAKNKSPLPIGDLPKKVAQLKISGHPLPVNNELSL